MTDSAEPLRTQGYMTNVRRDPLQFVAGLTEKIIRRVRSFVFVRFEALTAVTTKNAVFWNVTPCGSCKNRRFRGTCRLHHQGDKILHRVLQLLVIANVVPSLLILGTLVMKAIRSSESSVLNKIHADNIPKDCILHSHRSENQESFRLFCWLFLHLQHINSTIEE
jgi:hypothetical protein